MKILVVGNGGREHALVWKIRQSPLVEEVYCAPGNAGMARLADCVPIDTSNIIEVADFAQTISADLTVVGPELPMVLGIADEFSRRGLSIFCPSRQAAEIEGSKAFAREFMDRHHVPAPRHAICASREEAEQAVREGELGYPLVLKVDGLAAGKGVVVVDNEAEALAAVAEMMSDKKFGTAGAKLVLEEFLPGEEVSFLVFSDGSRVVPMVSVQDHKRVGDGDSGSNTGGMGTVSPSTSLSLDMHKQIMQEIILPTIGGLSAEGRKYQGVLYAGLMITDKGPRVLEFNARFGDPETQPILMRLESDLLGAFIASIERRVSDGDFRWSNDSSACVVLASAGYPGDYETGKEIHGLDEAARIEGVHVFHAGTAQRDGRFFTAGGRVLNVCARGKDLAEAVERAYAAAGKIHFDGVYYRHDIAARALKRK
jgi:phosphoribosylamine--glycine ligase